MAFEVLCRGEWLPCKIVAEKDGMVIVSLESGACFGWTKKSDLREKHLAPNRKKGII